MKKLEKTLIILVPVFIILKFIMVPLASVLVTMSLLLLATIYFPFAFALFNNIRLRSIFKKESYKDLSCYRIIGALTTGLALSDICVGILFKLQSYFGGNIILISGLLSILLILIIGLMQYLKSKSKYYSPIFMRIALIGSLGLVFLVLSDLTLVKIQFRNHPDYMKAYQAYKANPKNKESKESLKKEYMKATMSEEDFKRYQKDIKADTIN